ncbi:MAG: valine--tRNA ligase [Bacilli bacterium]|nr:valine--tRNA ligase [Bacilli bacterium]
MLDKKYNHLDIEKNLYSKWLNDGLFLSGDKTKTPYCIVMPPPNITGRLHLGHAWDDTLQDIIIRYKRMNGYDALWLPGMDHAGIATQAKIDQKLKDMGLNPRQMPREEWDKHAWAWKEEYADIIRKQWAKLGLSVDYSKERFTFDKEMNVAVNKVFIDLYNKGYIYKGTKPINWDPVAKTALSNIEVIYKTEPGKMYYLKYMFPNSDEFLEVATTRTETLASDTAVVVNPKDERFKHLIGKTVITPLRKEEVPIIADDYIDISFGTGAMKCSAHAANDVDILNKNNIKVRESIDLDGLLNENALEFKGMTREKARIAIADKLQKEGLITKIEDHIHEVGYSERTDAVIETMIMPQWFVKMDGLAKHTLDNQLNIDTKVNFVPSRFEKILNNWMENIQDWCISRQLWWGHRIPAWYKEDEMIVSVECPGEGFIQDPDVLDTWFSSALWPFATLGWPDNFDDRYFPNDVLVTGYDIIFFWVSRMIFESLEFTNKRPFKDVLIHGLIRDKDGRKMSKSLGNGVDPMEVIDKYGADSLRFFLTTNSAPGQDLRYDEDKIKSAWNFINKLWNASRFVLMSIEDYKPQLVDFNNLSNIDKWIINKLNNTIKDVRISMDKYEFHVAGSTLYNFIWNDFCDWYIELSKVNIEEHKDTLAYVLSDILKMLHPFMPYVTEEIYQILPDKFTSIMISEYPVYNDKINYNADEINKIIEIITKVRNVKQENNIGKDYLLINKLNDKESSIFNNNINIFNKLLKCNVVDSIDNNYKLITISFAFGDIIIGYIGNNNIEDEINNMKKEQSILISNIIRRTALLSNEGYLKKAPASLIEEEKNKLIEEQTKLDNINKKL